MESHETGVFFSIQGNCIKNYVFDLGLSPYKEGVYRPNHELFNKVICEWDLQGMSAYGIAHTHLQKRAGFSKGDLFYIRQIFEKNCGLQQMYFAIIVPADQIALYLAERNKDDISIFPVRLNIKECDL